jgi:hypothetical protein
MDVCIDRRTKFRRSCRRRSQQAASAIGEIIVVAIAVMVI